MSKDKLLPLESWLKYMANNVNNFPHGQGNYFERYVQIKSFLERNIYKWIPAGLASGNQEFHTDHSADHFDAVIRYAGKLLDITVKEDSDRTEIKLSPYEVFILLIAILLHDAGNVYGRREHERKAFKMLKDMGKGLCPDEFEAKFIAKIASAHGGKVKNKESDEETKDTIRPLDEQSTYSGLSFRPRLIAALVRFADEICEDRTRAASVIRESSSDFSSSSDIYHAYANTISSVDVDLRSKQIGIKYDLNKEDVLEKIPNDQIGEYLIDEINKRLEKMFCELIYCKAFMYEVVPINKIRATIVVHDDADELESQAFELSESGYPADSFSFRKSFPTWSGESVKKLIEQKVSK